MDRLKRAIRIHDPMSLNELIKMSRSESKSEFTWEVLLNSLFVSSTRTVPLESGETGLRADCSIWTKATSRVAGYYLGRFPIWAISTRAAMTQADGQQPIAEHTITGG
jgi:hypothetical protein